ncbi:hypothetical protein K435DRAFT_778516, partial [Dendrothele bispora CBS 962.96]
MSSLCSTKSILPILGPSAFPRLRWFDDHATQLPMTIFCHCLSNSIGTSSNSSSSMSSS